jgi:hypothetical protein
MLLRGSGDGASSPTRRQASGWRGGTLTAASGEAVTVFVSEAYPPEQVSAEAWAEFFAALPHGRELGAVVVRVATPAEVEATCGSAAVGCYRSNELVFVGEAAAGAMPEEVARHEYGHHVAADRENPPWRALDWGPKRWATAARVCGRVASGTAFPGDEGDRYRLNPGEAFAEAYRVLAERKAGAALSSWGVVDESFFPDEKALAAVEADVARPWTSPRQRTIRGRFVGAGSRRWTLRLAVPLDGEVTAELRLPRGRLDRLELLSAAGRVVSRGLWSGRTARRLAALVCGQRTLTLRVTRAGGPGPFTVTVAHP